MQNASQQAVQFTVPGKIGGKGRGYKKASDDQILAEYVRAGSVWECARVLGMCGQSVYERLQRLGRVNARNIFSDADKARLRVEYRGYADSGRLKELAMMFGRTRQFLCRQAALLGLTDRHTKKAYLGASISARTRAHIRDHGHPRGMLGKPQTDKCRKAVSAAASARWASMNEDERAAHVLKGMKVKAANGTLAGQTPHGSWKADWREIGGKRRYFRSRWEANYARYLEWLKANGHIKEWDHEPTTFWFDAIKRGCRSYLPDFLVTENSGAAAYHEVKGWMDDRSKTKIKRMAKYHPAVKLIVIDRAAYTKLAKQVAPLIHGWER